MAHKKVILIRHGRTKGNEEKRYIGRRNDETLSDKGIDEAKRAALRITEQIGGIPDRICTGPLRRTMQTAEMLFPESGQILVYDLTETEFGVFEGKNYQELNGDEDYQKWIDSGGNLDIPGGESRAVFIGRSFRAFKEALGDPAKDETVAIICHGGNVMAVMMRLTGGDFYDYMTGNLSGYKLELETDNERIDLIAYHKFDAGDNT